MFGRQHYKAIAKIIREATPRVLSTDYTLLDKESLVSGLVSFFERDNPLFDEDKFRKEIEK